MRNVYDEIKAFIEHPVNTLSEKYLELLYFLIS